MTPTTLRAIARQATVLRTAAAHRAGLFRRTAVAGASAAAALLGAMAGVAPTPAWAGANDGVTCPANTEARLNNGVLSCQITLVFERASVCPPVNFPNYTVMQIAGRDSCLPQGVAIDNKASVPSAFSPVGGPPTMRGSHGIPDDLQAYLRVVGTAVLSSPPSSAFNRVESASGSDRFVAEKTVFVWPLNFPGLSQVGRDPARGVSCPNSFQDVAINGNRGIRCEQREERTASCDIGWTIERDRAGNRDVCAMYTPVGRVQGNYTIPSGTTGLTGNPDSHGWNLRVRDGADRWVRETTGYTYAVAR